MKNPLARVPDSFRWDPALRGVPAAELEALAGTLWSREKAGQGLALVAALAATAAAFMVVGLGEVIIGSILAAGLLQALGQVVGETVVWVGTLMAGVITIVILPALAGEWAHRQVRDSFLNKALARLEGRRVCAGCLYDLHDLQHGQAAKCPECGRGFAQAMNEPSLSAAMSDADWAMLGRTLWMQKPVMRAWAALAGVIVGVLVTCAVACAGLPSAAFAFIESVSERITSGDVPRLLGFMVGASMALAPGVLAGVSMWRSIRRERVKILAREHAPERPCPQCLYRLTGLGDVKTCPECGWVLGKG